MSQTSSFSPSGEPYVPEAYTAPVVRTPSPVAVAKSKSKEKEKDKEKSKAALVATPDPAEEEVSCAGREATQDLRTSILQKIAIVCKR